jgi:hypothetical protein
MLFYLKSLTMIVTRFEVSTSILHRVISFLLKLDLLLIYYTRIENENITENN